MYIHIATDTSYDDYSCSIPVSVNKTLLRKILPVAILAFRSPNQVPDFSFCRWIAGHGLAEKDCFCSQTLVGSLIFLCHDICSCIRHTPRDTRCKVQATSGL